MKRKLLTDIELRSRWSRDRAASFCVGEGTILTPAARDFIREQGIELRFTPAAEVMTRAPIPFRNGKPVYQDAATGEELTKKPEDMTHLRGNLLVPKTHPRIEFRGRLDSLMAQILGVQLVADECHQPQLSQDLEDLLQYTRAMLAAEVKDEPLPALNLMGMDSEQIRWQSHNVRQAFGIDHPVPNHNMGRVCVSLNRLRTQVREVELAAARTFESDSGCTRTDIIEGLNRMSSCVYIIFCRKLSGYYDRECRL